MRRLLVAMLLVLATLIPGATVAGAATNYTCTVGVVPPGTYQNLTIAGDCSIPAGTVVVMGDLMIKPGAALNAAIPPGGTLTVYGDAMVGKDAILVLGCAPSICPTKVTNDKIYGSLRADRPLALILHGNWIGGHVSVMGGGGGLTCDPNAHLGAVIGFPGIPAYSTFEGNTITGGLSVSGLQSCWFGLIRNDIRGAVTLQNNKLLDPDAMEVVTNTIRGSLKCYGNMPAPQVGDSEGEMNKVTGAMLGQCAMIK